MKWTNDKPTKIGWYWRRSGPHYLRIVEIVPYQFGRDPAKLGIDRVGDYPLDLNVTGDDFWAGPIPKPTDD